MSTVRGLVESLGWSREAARYEPLGKPANSWGYLFGRFYMRIVVVVLVIVCSFYGFSSLLTPVVTDEAAPVWVGDEVQVPNPQLASSKSAWEVHPDVHDSLDDFPVVDLPADEEDDDLHGSGGDDDDDPGFVEPPEPQESDESTAEMGTETESETVDGADDDVNISDGDDDDDDDPGFIVPLESQESDKSTTDEDPEEESETPDEVPAIFLEDEMVGADAPAEYKVPVFQEADKSVSKSKNAPIVFPIHDFTIEDATDSNRKEEVMDLEHPEYKVVESKPQPIKSAPVRLHEDKSGKSGSSDHHNTYETDEHSSNGAVSNRRLVLVFFSSYPSPDMCKSLLSGYALGYPAPIIVNWNVSAIEEFHGRAVGSHLLKILGGHQYLEETTHPDMPEGDKLHDDDLVVMADSSDIWFQLPPQTFIARYHNQIREANDRLQQEWGSGVMPYKQTILISAQKKCFPRRGPSNTHCDDLPESPMPKDLYGPMTDKDPKNFQKTRTKYINSGAIVGPVGDLRKYFRRTKEKLDEMRSHARTPGQIVSDQGVFGEIWGEQEIWRKWKRNHKKSEEMRLVKNRFEYHVGLDYIQELSLPTVFSEEDGDFVLLSNQTDIDKRSRQLNITTTRLKGVPDDLINEPNPLAKLPNRRYAPDWADMPLYADFFTTAIPVILHNNAHSNGLKARRVWWWDRTWFFPHLRELVLAQLPPTKLKPLGRADVDGIEAVYWPLPAEENKRLPRIFWPGKAQKGLPTEKFENLCRYKTYDPFNEPWWDEVFRDGKKGI